MSKGLRHNTGRLLAVVIILLVLAVAAASGLWQQYQQFLRTPLLVTESGLVFEVRRGTNIRSVVAELARRGVTRAGWHWRLLNKLQASTIQAGEYTLAAGMTPTDLLRLLSSGKVVSYRFTIVEGWNVVQLLAALERDPVLQHNAPGVDELVGLDGLPAGHSEGWFLPETYVFVRGDSDLSILRRAYRAMQHALLETWAGRAEHLPFETSYELLILASIVEKETSREDERAAIAGVFVRRLQNRWRLETDPSVIYGMGEAYDGDIRRRDLDADTAYNTYRRHGLPPTPIALPGLASLRAAAHPEAGDAMFFVADGQGGHTFSATLEGHNKAVRKMLRRGAGQQEKKR